MSTLDKVLERAIAQNGVPRLTQTVLVRKDACVPGMFDKDVEIKMGALTSAQEIAAARRAKGDPVVFGFEMLRFSILEVDGAPFNPASPKGEAFWEALGQPVRFELLNLYQMLGLKTSNAEGIEEGAEGKAQMPAVSIKSVG